MNSNWIECSKELPKHGINVLAFYKNELGKSRIVRACYYEKFKEESDIDYESNDEYCKDDDTYYIIEGWYECVNNWDDYLSCYINEGEVTHWMPLPKPPQ